MSKIYLGFEALKNGYQELPKAGRLYTKPKINKNNICDAEFIVIPSAEVEDYTKEAGGLIPNQISGKGYHSWLEAPTFNDVISLKFDHDPSAKLEDLLDAVFYYLENDAFME